MRKISQQKRNRMTRPEPYEDLANAIIKLAVQDYVRELRCARRHKNDNYTATRFNAEMQVHNLEAFFLSQWFGILSDLNPSWLISEVRKKVDRE